MPDITVSTPIDTFMQSADQATMRTNLGLGDAATKNTGTTAGTVAAGNDSRITGALQTSGGTMTGRIVAAADNSIAKISLGARTLGSSPTALVDGDIWISNQGALSYRDSTGPTSRAVAVTSLSNTFNQPQTIGSTANAGAVLAVSNSGTREVVTISNTTTATSDAVVITNLGSGNSLVVNDETTPDSTRFAVANNGRVGIGVAPDAVVALAVDSTGIKFSDGTTQTTAASGGSGTVTSITAGTGLTGGTITTSGTVAADFGTTTGKVTEGGTTVLKTGDTMTGKLALPAAAANAPLNITPSGLQPTTVLNGDIWIRNNLIQYRGSSATVNSVAATAEPNVFTTNQAISPTGSTTSTALAITQNASNPNGALTVDLNNTSSTATAVRITNQGTGASLVVEDQSSVDPSPFTISNSGKVGVGVAPDALVALSVDASGIKFSDGSVQTTASGGGVAGVSSFSAGTTGLTPATGTTGAVTLGGTLGVANGGTGATTLTGIVKGSGTSALSAAVAGTDYVVPSGSITGTASNVTGTVAIANGGTGQTTANSALNALLPSQASNSGKVLSTDGTNTSWVTAGGGSGTVTSVDVSGGTTGLTTSGGPVTSSGTITLAGTLALANGGTGATTQSGAANAVLPSQATNSGKFLTTDGSNVSWATAGGGGGGTPVDRQVFASSGTWTKPAGAKLITITGISGGSSGGRGPKIIPGTLTGYGGTGGASGQRQTVTLPAEYFPSSISISIPALTASFYPSYLANAFGTNTLNGASGLLINNLIYIGNDLVFTSTGNTFPFNSSAAAGLSTGFDSNPGLSASGVFSSQTQRSSTGGSPGGAAGSSGSIVSGFLPKTVFLGISIPALTTNFTSQPTAPAMAGTGSFGDRMSGGGNGGIASLNASGFAGSGGDAGAWYPPVNLTSVSTTNNSKNVTCASTTGLAVGMGVVNCPSITSTSGSTQLNLIESITGPTTFTLKSQATQTASNQTALATCGYGGGGGGGGLAQASTPILIRGVNLTSGSTTVDCTSTRGVLVGLRIFDNANIPDGTTVASVVSETQFTISAAATGSEIAGKLVVAGVGTIPGFATTSGSQNATISSTLGLTWGQAIYSTGGIVINTATSSGYWHIDAVTSATAFTVSANATNTATAQTLRVMNCVGFLDGVSTTQGSPVVSVSDATPLYAGMAVTIVGSGTWSTTSGSTTATATAAFPTTLSNTLFVGDGVSSSSATTGSVTSGSTSITLSSAATATVSNKPFYYANPTSVLALPAPLSSTGVFSYAKILSVDKVANQITLNTNALATVSGQSIAYAFVGGAGGPGGGAAVEIITQF